MKKIIPLFCGSLIFLFFSCSNPQSSVLTSQESTLRNAVQEKNSNTVWTKEIEPDKLSAKISTNINVQNKALINPQMLNTVKMLQPAVYPEIKGFASMDCTSMNQALLQTLTEFCNSLSEGTQNISSFFDYEYFYNCVFFINDLKELVGEDKENEKLFTSYYICKGFEGDELIQVPVRFYKNKKTLDLSVYLTYHGGYKVIQIEILGWGKTYGESEKTK